MTRKEHLEWAKQRALEYVDAGDIAQAYMSMRSDLSKHVELEAHPYMQFFDMKYIGGMLQTPDRMRREIEGFN